MNTKEIQTLESYFKTENEHWNSYAFEMLCEVLQKGEFDNPETPLELFSRATNNLSKECETPLKAVETFGIITENLNSTQKLFVYQWVLKYLKNSEFDNADTSEIEDLLKSQINRLKKEIKKLPENIKPLVSNIRNTLKELMLKEIEQLPNTLKELEPLQRLNILCKLIPYVLPKVEAVHSERGEPEIENKSNIPVFEW